MKSFQAIFSTSRQVQTKHSRSRTPYGRLAVLGMAFFFLTLQAQAGPGAVAKIKSVDRTIDAKTFEVTLEGVKGEIQNGDSMEVDVGGSRVRGTISLPEGIRTFTQSMVMKRVELKMASAASVQSGQSVGIPGGAAAAPAGPRPTVKTCPYTPGELASTLGIPPLKKSQERETAFTGGKQLLCMYVPERGTYSAVNVTQVLMHDGSSTGSLQKFYAGNKEPIPGDPDGATWQTGQGDLEDVSLVYQRHNVDVNVRVSIENQKDRAAVQRMREKVLRLRRVP